MRMTSLRKIGSLFSPVRHACPAPLPPSSYGVQSWACASLAEVFDRTGRDADFRSPQVCQIERLRTLCGHPLSYRLRLPDGTPRSVPAAIVRILPAEAHLAADVVDLGVYTPRLMTPLAAE
ncbi:hypothetical protein ACE4RV_06225 [Acetobacter persici]|uniref:hypothetical protein n=1 Tax=Acetobacter persici TaxID=1076596 RepID=UPI0036DB1D38